MLLIIAALTCLPLQEPQTDRQSPPELLTFEELVQLFEVTAPPEPLRAKLLHLVTTPFVSNEASQRGVTPVKPNLPKLGKSLRVVFWNIERGVRQEAIEAVLTDPERFASLLDQKRYPPKSIERERILKQVEMLKQADVITLNEVDWGMKRTGYRNVIADLAAALNMNYAFGVEFVYPGPAVLKLEDIDEEIMDVPDGPLDPNPIDPTGYKGLHGNAILSRYPLENVRMIPLGTSEGDSLAKKKGEPEDERLRKIQMVRETKRGARMALLADIVDPELPGGRVTIISTHLDARTKPHHRTKQLERLLSAIKDIEHPVILAGDMNTAAMDTTFGSVWQQVKGRAQSKEFWFTRGIAYFTGFGLLLDAVWTNFRYARTQADPTVRHIPFIAPNPGACFFTLLKKHRFSDGGAFDFRGDRTRSFGRRKGTLSNSNQRGVKGFMTTFELGRTVGSVGQFKLDWIFVKPAALTHPGDKKQSYRFAPHFGRTLRQLNYSVKGRISDHHPLVVDLPLEEPPLGR